MNLIHIWCPHTFGNAVHCKTYPTLPSAETIRANVARTKMKALRKNKPHILIVITKNKTRRRLLNCAVDLKKAVTVSVCVSVCASVVLHSGVCTAEMKWDTSPCLERCKERRERERSAASSASAFQNQRRFEVITSPSPWLFHCLT